MRVLVTVGSRHGSTRSIGERVADVLQNYGLDVDVDTIANVKKLCRYNAVVLGSSVYMGRWTTDARVFLSRFGDELASMPTWVFSSGPTGDPAFPLNLPEDHEKVVHLVHAESARVFAGKLDLDAINLAERLVVKMIHAPVGDFRNWQKIDAWTEEIGESLASMHLESKMSS